MKRTPLKASLPPINVDLGVFTELAEVYDWGLLDLNIPEVHKKTLGEDIKICIIDSGKSEHFETINNTIEAKNFSTSPTVVDKRGHSTFCAGIIAAEKNNDGIIGVAPKSKLYFAKAIDDSGSGNPAALVKSVHWAVEKKVDIISISAGMFFDFKPLHAAIKEAHSKNIITVAAVGNTANRHFNVAFPARYPEVIGVAAYGKNHKAADFSSRGLNVFCAAPGVDIFSTWIDNQFCKSSGSSFACPIITGICALILSKHRKNPGSTPCETPKQMMEHLKKYARKLDDNPNAVGFGTIDTGALFDE